MEVVALKLGYYNHRRRKPGQKFRIKEKRDFSTRWMKAVNPKEAESAAKAAIEAKRKAFKIVEDIKAGVIAEPVYPLPAAVVDPLDEDAQDLLAEPELVQEKNVSDTMVI